MQSYGRVFARVYNSEFTGFVKKVAPQIEEYYAQTPLGRVNTSVLDLCCGTGQLAFEFASKGYRVLGIDSSEYMLQYAKENNRRYVETGQVRFIQGDVSDFTLNERFGLVVSTYDSINHLESEALLRKCFQSISDVLVNDGYFIFDLNTRASLVNWNSIQIIDNERLMMMSRGAYDGYSKRALIKISGFVHVSDELYERFDQTIINSAFKLEMIEQLLLEIGWENVWFARIEDLTMPIDEPEKVNNENEVFVVAHK